MTLRASFTLTAVGLRAGPPDARDAVGAGFFVQRRRPWDDVTVTF